MQMDGYRSELDGMFLLIELALEHVKPPYYSSALKYITFNRNAS